MSATFIVGDVLDVGWSLEPQSVDLIVTSPPFLALRSYLPLDHPDKGKEGGQQATPGEFIDWLIDVVEVLSLALAPHGSLVFELGDTYSGSGGGGGDYYEGGKRAGQPGFTGSANASREAHKAANASHYRQKNAWKTAGGYDRKFGGTLENRVQGGGGPGWPAGKSKVLVPELFRLALTYGFNPLTGRETPPWLLRNVITWCRPNPTPGILSDKVRPATSDIMCFTKRPDRWFDIHSELQPFRTAKPGVNWNSKDGPNPNRVDHGAGAFAPASTEGSPLLDWWELTAGGYDGAHYAVWPPELVKRLINLMCPTKVCTTCGQPSRRITAIDKTGMDTRTITPETEDRSTNRVAGTTSGWGITQMPTERAGTRTMVSATRTVGWSDCHHNTWREGVVLDPFAGSGTTLSVASGMGRTSIGIDLDDRNLALARERIGMFLTEEKI